MINKLNVPKRENLFLYWSVIKYSFKVQISSLVIYVKEQDVAPWWSIQGAMDHQIDPLFLIPASAAQLV